MADKLDPGWLSGLKRKYGEAAELRSQEGAALMGFSEAEKAVRRHFPPPPGEALVIGCGAGREVMPLAAEGIKVTGVDLVAPVLDSCRALLGRKGLPAELTLLDCPWVLPFPDRRFAQVIAFGQLLEHLPEREERLALLKEIRRVLRPGGHLYLSTHAVEPSDGVELSYLAIDPARPEAIKARQISPAASRGQLRLHLYSQQALAVDLTAAGLGLLSYLIALEPGPGHPVWRRFLYAVSE